MKKKKLLIDNHWFSVKIILSLFLVVIIINLTLAQTPTTGGTSGSTDNSFLLGRRVKQLQGGPPSIAGRSVFNSVATDTLGNIYAIGSYKGTIRFTINGSGITFISALD